MANASFYRPKFETIDLITNSWVGGHILTWWQSLSSCLNKTSLLTSEFEQIVFMKVLGNCLSFPTKQEDKELKHLMFDFLKLFSLTHVTSIGSIVPKSVDFRELGVKTPLRA